MSDGKSKKTVKIIIGVSSALLLLVGGIILFKKKDNTIDDSGTGSGSGGNGSGSGSGSGTGSGRTRGSGSGLSSITISSGSGTGSGSGSVIDPRITFILNYLRDNSKFATKDDALYLINNINNVGEDIRPTDNDIKTALLHSSQVGWVYYDNNIEDKMQKIGVNLFLFNKAPKGTDGLTPIQKYNGGFDNPVFTDWTTSDLKKLVAHGWWLGLIRNSIGSDFKKIGDDYVVIPYNLINSNDNAQLVMVPKKEDYSGGKYSLGFSGANEISRHTGSSIMSSNYKGITI